jgi:hypothetical protein
MNRITVECLLKAYAGALMSAIDTALLIDACEALQAHLVTTHRLLARWQGGESEAALKAALQTEMHLYQAEALALPDVKSVARAFRHCCRAVGVTMIDSGVPLFAPSQAPPATSAQAECDAPPG